MIPSLTNTSLTLRFVLPSPDFSTPSTVQPPSFFWIIRLVLVCSSSSLHCIFHIVTQLSFFKAQNFVFLSSSKALNSSIWLKSWNLSSLSFYIKRSVILSLDYYCSLVLAISLQTHDLDSYHPTLFTVPQIHDTCVLSGSELILHQTFLALSLFIYS